MKILLVDDDETFRSLISVTLNSAGYTDVATAESGEAALHMLANTDAPFDAFLIDIRMPGIDGIELCSCIRSMARYKKSPIIMITAYPDRVSMEDAFHAGASDYVSKPVDGLELGTRVRVAAQFVQELKVTNRGAFNISRKAQTRARCATKIRQHSVFRAAAAQ